MKDETYFNIQEFLTTCKKDEKGRYIVPDEIMEAHYKELPEGTVNESGNRAAYKGGMINVMNNSPEAMEARRKGGEVTKAKYEQRRTFADTIEYLLRKKASAEDREAYGLEGDATQQDVIMAAMLRQAKKGNVKAGTFLRDTIGQQPVAKSEITADIMTDADRELLEKVTARLGKAEESQ